MFELAATGLALAVPFAAVAQGLAANTAYTGNDDPQLALRLTLGMAACLPWYLLVVHGAVRGRHHPLSGWAVAAIGVLAVCGLPLLGPPWIYSMLVVATAVLLALPAPWSWVVFAGLVTVVTPALSVGFGIAPLWPALMTSKALAIDIMFRLVGSVRRVRRARAELVAAAVAQERLRVEAEVGSAVSADLAEIARRARLTCPRDVGSRAETTASAIGELTDLSRSALARARGLIHGYRDASVRAEIELAATLLRAGGIAVEVRDDALTPASGELDPAARAELHDEIARLLADQEVRHVTLSADVVAGQPRVRIDEWGDDA
ncbi:MAG: hypothetical protein M3235_13870 [Actinomycetota bacterium]|nr:hypothetical protein [Actinomycetota bacterium]